VCGVEEGVLVFGCFILLAFEWGQSTSCLFIQCKLSFRFYSGLLNFLLPLMLNKITISHCHKSWSIIIVFIASCMDIGGEPLNNVLFKYNVGHVYTVILVPYGINMELKWVYAPHSYILLSGILNMHE